MNGRSPEIVALLAVCSDELTPERHSELTAFLSRNQLNWDRLYKLAGRHRVSPFLYRTLYVFPNVPKKISTALQNDCRTIATDNLLKLNHYRQLKQTLTNEGISHMPLKGIHLAASSYSDSGLRSIGDLDILVKKKDALTAIHLLKSQGYQLNQQHTHYQQHNERSMLSDLREVSLFKPFFNNSYFDIDLHWGFVCLNKDYKVFELDEIESQPDLLLEWQIIILVTHHGVTDVWQKIYYINDLYFLLRNKTIDWSWLMQQMRLYGIEMVFLVGLHWCQQIWDLPLPPSIELLIAKDDRVHRLASAYEKNWESAVPLIESNLVVARVTFFAKAQTQAGKQLKMGMTFFSSRVFRASTFKIGDRMLYIPKEMGFITVFIRALRSLARAVSLRQ